MLYYRLGSYEMAESLLRQALDDTRLEGSRERTLAQTLLRDVSARNQPSQLRGMLMIGVRRQSNPSARSDAADQVLPLARHPAGRRLQAQIRHRHPADRPAGSPLRLGLAERSVRGQLTGGADYRLSVVQRPHLARQPGKPLTWPGAS